MPASHVTVEGKKYMWDGETYPGEKEAGEAKKKYEADGFEVQVVNEEGQVAVYTRRVVTEIVLEGAPP
ncbi:MAG: hypothetical protein E3J35_03510 [Methanomassiliicoccales archaeon]|nr:MAG: hypothetical protein E3J35_03510 [Methanomassiliicoccales archaeon]